VGVESLAGRKIASYLEDMNHEIGVVTPGLRLFLTQHIFEPLLRTSCKELDAELRFSTEVTDVQQDAEGCISTVKNLQTGETRKIKSKYVVACDGSRSPMRKRLGIQLIGYGEMSRSITIYFKVSPYHCRANTRPTSLVSSIRSTMV
jgi:2-polyprenyl-6-methoxyphenol hydroxylase-like FAD-dependent oxidoreductase